MYIILFFSQKRKVVALNHYETTLHSRTDSSEGDEGDTIHGLATSATTIARYAEGNENAGFEHSREHDKNEEKRGAAREVSNPDDTKLDQSNVKGKNRKVRFDLRGEKVKNERRAVMKNIPDIIVISEEAGANEQIDENERKRACDEVCLEDDDNDNMPTDSSSIFEDSRENLASVSSLSDKDGAVVAI